MIDKLDYINQKLFLNIFDNRKFVLFNKTFASVKNKFNNFFYIVTMLLFLNNEHEYITLNSGNAQ